MTGETLAELFFKKSRSIKILTITLRCVNFKMAKVLNVFSALCDTEFKIFIYFPISFLVFW